jgi:putative transposase
MDENQGLFKITAMSRVLQVSRSGFYRWRKRQQNPSARQLHRLILNRLFKRAFNAGKGHNGAPRLVLYLADAGHQYDRKTVANSMCRHGLRAKAARKFKVQSHDGTVGL